MSDGGRGRSKSRPRKEKRNRVSDSSGDELFTPKRDRGTSYKPQKRDNLNVSDIIFEANAVLYDDNIVETEIRDTQNNEFVQGSSTSTGTCLHKQSSKECKEFTTDSTSTNNSNSKINITNRADKDQGHKNNSHQNKNNADQSKKSMSGNQKTNKAATKTSHGEGAKADNVKGQPGIPDVLAAIAKLQLQVNDVDDRLKTLTVLEQKVDNIDRDMKTLWTHINDQEKSTKEKITDLDDRIDSVAMSAGLSSDAIDQVQKENKKLKEQITYLQSQSMRNNLIFGNIEENVNEKISDTEIKLRDFLINKLQMAEDFVNRMKMDRVHRMGPPNNPTSSMGDSGKVAPRRIVCKFTEFQDREIVRKRSAKLKGTNFFITEQFPPEINKIRKDLWPKMKEARSKDQTAWISYDTLYINGKPVKTG